MDKQTLKVQPRKIIGRKVKGLRLEGILPGNLYGKKIKSQPVQVSKLDFEKIFEKTGETGLVELAINGKKKSVLIHNVQLDPVNDKIIHVDFLQVDLKEKVTAQVPVELIGEAPAEKEGKGTIVHHIDEVEVEALPTDLPEKFDIDLSHLKEVDQIVKVSDLEVDKGKIEIKNDPQQIIVKVEPPRKIEEEIPPKEEEVEEEAEEKVEEEAPEAVEGKPKAEEVKKEEKEKEGEPKAKKPQGSVKS